MYVRFFATTANKRTKIEINSTLAVSISYFSIAAFVIFHLLMPQQNSWFIFIFYFVFLVCGVGMLPLSTKTITHTHTHHTKYCAKHANVVYLHRLSCRRVTTSVEVSASVAIRFFSVILLMYILLCILYASVWYVCYLRAVKNDTSLNTYNAVCNSFFVRFREVGYWL